jgi:hypothetical protein
MKKLALIISLALSGSIFSQNEGSLFNYKAKFEGVNDATKATPIINAMKMVFKTNAAFNEASGKVEFASKMSISQTVFNNMMSGEGFQVESFERQEVKAETPAPAQTNTVTAAEAKKTPAEQEKGKTVAVKKDAPAKAGSK